MPPSWPPPRLNTDTNKGLFQPVFHIPLPMILGLINIEQAKSLARDAVKYLGALLLAKGIGDATLIEAAAGLAVAIVGSVWSQLNAKQANIVATAAAIVPISPVAQVAAGVVNPTIPNVKETHIA